MTASRLSALAFVAVALLPRSAQAMTIPKCLLEVVQEADLIAVGEIDLLDDTRYQFRIEEVLKGDHDLRSIRVRRFHDWVCARRWGPYAVGQRLLVMLSRERDGVWSIIGGDCQGESPMLGDDVICAFGLDVIRPARMRKVKVGEWGDRYVVRLSAVRHALAELPKHWDIETAAPGRAVRSIHCRRAAPVSSPYLRKYYASRSPFHRTLEGEAAYQRQLLRAAGLQAR